MNVAISLQKSFGKVMADAAATIKPWQQEPNRCTEFHLPAPLQLHLQIFKADTTDMGFF